MKDNDMKRKENLYRFAQWTWGLPQTLCGAAVYLRFRNNPHESYHGAVVTVWLYASSVSLGMYIFISKHLIRKRGRISADHRFTEDPAARGIVQHEYGHTIQSLMTGPLYLILIGLPSVIWNQTPALERLRQKKKISYYAVFPEKQADSLGERFLRK